MIPFVNLKAQRDAYREEFLEAESRVLDSGNYIGGKEIAALEQELSEYTHVRNVVTCASGTDALELALEALGLEPGDEVIIPDFTFISPAECVARLGGIPRFADIDPKTYLIDPSKLGSLVTSKTVGIIAVHLFGQIAAMEEIEAFAKSKKLWVIGDAAQAFGAKRNEKQSLAFGDISITSFYPTKPLGAYGDGGAIFTKHANLAEKVQKLANHGAKSSYFHEIIGKNSRLDALQAAILRVKLKHLDIELDKRRQNAALYNDFFKEFNNLKVPHIEKGNVSTFAQYTLRSTNRKFWQIICEKAKIPCGIYYPRTLASQPCFAQSKIEVNLNAELACNEVFSLPVCAFTDVEACITALRNNLE